MSLHCISPNYQLHKMIKIHKMHKSQNEKTQIMIKKHQKKGGSNFGLKTGSRGTPWNRKNAGPGGSDFTKCRFWSFKWHFGHFGGGVNFWCFFHFFTFLISHFCNFCIFWFCWICHFFDFVDFHVFVISWFLINFVDFLLLWCFFVTFRHYFRCLIHDTLFF